ncbi:MAG: hypothetical protein ABIH26_03435 [Candidatus Eisenbacteria bacterium]
MWYPPARRYVPIRERRAELFFLAVFSALLALHALSFRYTVDDAFISFRYAENWALGEGPVFNPGERVEGYTNFLWTALIAAALRGGIEPVLFSRAAGIAFGVLLLCLAFLHARERLSPRAAVLLLPPAIAANGAFALWCGAGLETPLFALLLFAGVAAASSAESARGFALASLLLVLATLTRPEGALVFAVVLLDALALRRVPLGRALPGLLLFLLVAGAHEAWRIAYYGEALPNTFYAKTGGGLLALKRGLLYVARYLGPFGGWTALAPLPLLFVGGIRRWERTFLVVLIVYILYVVWVGGDSLPFYRFLAPAVPLFALLAVSGLARLLGDPGGSVGGGRLAALAFLLAVPLLNTFGGATLRFLGEDRDRVELHWKVIGGWLRENAEEGASVAVTTAGAIPYYSKLPAIDMLGINDRTIARRRMPGMGGGIADHEKHDMDYVLSRRPTYILHYPFLLPEPLFTTGQFRTPWNRGLEGLLANDTFDREYGGESAAITPPGSGRPLHLVYFRLREGGGS